MTIKIHGLGMSTCCMRVLMTLVEKEVTDFEIVPVDILKGAQKAPEFLALQPFGQIPVFEDGDLTLFESRAICRYIGDKYASQGTNLFGTTPEEKAKINVWADVESCNYNPPITSLVYEKAFKGMFGAGECDEEVAKKQEDKLSSVLDVYEKILEKQPYIAGKEFTYADIAHVPYTHYLVTAAKKGDLISSRPNVAAWWERISTRPSFKKVLAMK